MKWIHTIKQKSRAAAALGIIFLLVFVTNRLDKERFSDLDESTISLYEDRLVAKNLLFQLSNLIHTRTQWINDAKNLDKFSNSQKEIQSIIDQYELTELTQNEAEIFGSLKRKLRSLKSADQHWVAHYPTENKELNLLIQRKQDLVLADIEKLANIQIIEGKRLVDGSSKLVATSAIVSQLEAAILIIILMMVIGLVLESKSMVTRIQQKHFLN